ncbi:MAG: sulfotransferase domain-containing protein [Crocosphaera sp.]|nr:sulfotransferase domain-containing protein [Crocosphaera sp.]
MSRFDNLRKGSILSYRILTSPLRAKPDFLVIGGMKCGSSSLYQYLLKHPNVYPPLTKELYYFSTQKFTQKSFAWYRSNFPISKPNYMTGEATPDYIFYAKTAQRVANKLPSVKLISILRNPIDRAYSHYHHSVSLGWENNSFEEAIKLEKSRLSTKSSTINDGTPHPSHKHSYLSRGLYLKQLKEWFCFFPREQILILKAEDLYSQPKTTMNRVFQFLNLPANKIDIYKTYNSRNYAPIKPEVRQKLIDYFKPEKEKLYEYLGVNFNWDK